MNCEVLADTAIWKRRWSDFLCRARQTGKAELSVFHGIANPAIRDSLWDFLQRHSSREAGVWFAFLGCKNDAIMSVEDVCRQLSLLKIEILFQPMLFQKGHFYDLLAETAAAYGADIAEPIQENQIAEALLRAKGNDSSFRIVMLHASRGDGLYLRLKALCVPYGLYICRNISDINMLNLPPAVTLSTCYMLPGNHVRHDIFGEADSIYTALTAKGCKVSKDLRTLIDFL